MPRGKAAHPGSHSYQTRTFLKGQKAEGACPGDPLLQAGLEGLQEATGPKGPVVTWERELLRRTCFPAGKGMDKEPQRSPAVSVWKWRESSAACPNATSHQTLGSTSAVPFLPADLTKP